MNMNTITQEVLDNLSLEERNEVQLYYSKSEDREFDSLEEEVESSDYQSMLERKISSNLAMFDSHVFNIL